MPRTLILSLLVGSAPMLGGCLAAMAANAVGAAAGSARGRPQSNEAMQPEAGTACRAAAAQYGTVHVIDVEQRTIGKIVVWGTVDDGTQRRSFECAYGTKVTGFKLRPIPRR